MNINKKRNYGLPVVVKKTKKKLAVINFKKDDTVRDRILTVLPDSYKEYLSIPVFQMTEAEIFISKSPAFKKLLAKQKLEILTGLLVS